LSFDAEMGLCSQFMITAVVDRATTQVGFFRGCLLVVFMFLFVANF
jgi:hypothetical protein